MTHANFFPLATSRFRRSPAPFIGAAILVVAALSFASGDLLASRGHGAPTTTAARPATPTLGHPTPSASASPSAQPSPTAIQPARVASSVPPVTRPSQTALPSTQPLPTPTLVSTLTLTAAQQATQDIIDRVSRLTTLPPEDLAHGEPTLATVLDVSKLAGQPFFAQAQNADKVLIYTRAKLAYLYRPSTDALITSGPLTTSSPTP